MDIFLSVLLVIVVYLIVLNAFLNGRFKDRVNDILCVFLIAVVAIVFLTFGWKIGLISIGLCFISVGAVRPFARSTARFLFTHIHQGPRQR